MAAVTTAHTTAEAAGAGVSRVGTDAGDDGMVRVQLTHTANGNLADPAAADPSGSSMTVADTCGGASKAADSSDARKVDIIPIGPSRRSVTSDADNHVSAGFSVDELCQLKYLYGNYILRLGQHAHAPCRVRQKALFFFRRFYATHSFVQHDPLLFSRAALYFAYKASELPRNVKRMLEPLQHDPLMARQYTEEELRAAELEIMNGLEHDLRCSYPTESIKLYLSEVVGADDVVDADSQRVGITALYLANDSFKSDIILLHSQEVVGLACIRMAYEALQLACPPALQSYMNEHRQSIDKVASALAQLLRNSKKLDHADHNALYKLHRKVQNRLAQQKRV